MEGYGGWDVGDEIKEYMLMQSGIYLSSAVWLNPRCDPRADVCSGIVRVSPRQSEREIVQYISICNVGNVYCLCHQFICAYLAEAWMICNFYEY